ncbi:MAG: Ig-like domain-containing protein [Micrococcales bacterium]
MSIKFTKRAAASALSLSLAVTAVISTGYAASATSAADRTAAVNQDTTYLQDALGLPSDTVIESVTYDRFQWLLQQSGQFAFIIGSASDTNFAANAVKVDTAAKAAGAAKVYWFDPNLTGQGSIKSLDIRNTANINLSSSSRTIFGNVWKNVLGQYLGNGIKSVPVTARTSVTITNDDTVINDKVDPLFDFSTGATPAAAATDDLFFTYDKANLSGSDADKIVSWVNLSTNADVAAALPGAFTAIGGGSVIDELGQFAWWKDSANFKHDLAYSDDARYGGDILTDADDDNGWVIKQITYPELLHLLDQSDSASKNFVILFGGTWCHNTRAVVKFINQDAIRNGVTTVYNFDLVLDGGTTNGTNGGSNPIHVRSAANSGTNFSFRPSWVYGDVVRKYFKNLVTEYDPNTGSHVTYYPGGDLTAFPDVVRRLQVPFLINYQRGTAANPATTSIKRQWIQTSQDASTGLNTYKEYMSEWWFTNPSAQLGLTFAIPADENTLSDADKLALAGARANAAFGAQAVADLNVFFDGLPGAVVPTRTVTAPSVATGNASTVSLRLGNLYGRTPAGNATLRINSVDYTAAVTNGAASFTTANLPAGSYDYTITYATDSQIVGFTHTGSLTVTKLDVANVTGRVTKAPTKRASGTLKVTVVKSAGQPAIGGSVQVTLRNGTTTKVITSAVANGGSNVALPKLAKGSWAIELVYLGDTTFNTKSITISSVKVK